MKKLILLIIFVLLLTGCHKQEAVVEVLFDSITDGVGLGSSFYGLEPGVATKQDVMVVMAEYPYFDKERLENPYQIFELNLPISDYEVYTFALLQEVGFSVDFKFTLEGDLIRVVLDPYGGVTVGDVITRFGEPDNVVFFVIDFGFDSYCGIKLNYDGLRMIIHPDIEGNPEWKWCRITKNTKLSSISISTGPDFENDLEDFLTQWHMESDVEMYQHPWEGFGNLFGLYPEYPDLVLPRD